ncbi:MAG: hypothetical protein IRZ32_12955, partial [Solirubrobacteraceae bacterium]|nr:hypothetical protein [Solirubrobacteraceae bacterium]
VTVPLAGLAPGTPVVVRAGDGPRAPVAVRVADGRPLPAAATVRAPAPPRGLVARRQGARVRVTLRATAPRTVVQVRDRRGVALRARRLRTRPGRRVALRLAAPRAARTVAAASVRDGAAGAAVVRRIRR